MTKWRDGGAYGHAGCLIVNEDGKERVAFVITKHYKNFRLIDPWSEGEENFRLILKAPQMLEALESIVALDPAYWCQTEPGNAVCDQCKEIARTAIAAVKEEQVDEKA